MNNMNKVNLVKVAGLVVFLFVFGVGIAQAAPKKEPKIIVGANLKVYKQPSRKQCDINVPKQYPTIQAGIDAAVAGNTVCVGAGTYNEKVKIIKSIRLSGSGSRSIIKGNDLYATIEIIAGDVVVEGFVINGVGPGIHDSAILILADAGSNITIQHNRIVAAEGSAALRSDSSARNYIIRDNVIVGANSSWLLFFDRDLQDLTILNNTFKGTLGLMPVRPIGTVVAVGAPNTLIARNVFKATGAIRYLITYGCTSGAINVNYNNFNSDASDGKVGTCVGTLSAENNWWGDLDPSDNVQGNVDFTPFATKPFEQYHVKRNK